MADKKNIEAILPLLRQQTSMLVYCDGSANDPGLMQVRFELVGSVSQELLREAWSDVVRRHQSLRMTVHTPKTRAPMSVIWKRVETPWSYEDWSDLDPGERKTKLAEFLDADRQKGLELSEAPPMRFSIFRLSADRCQVVWTCHHLLLDGWSARIVIDEIVAACGASLPKLGITLREYRADRQSANDEAAVKHWRDELSGCEPLLLAKPGGSPRSSQEVLQRHLPNAVVKKINQGNAPAAVLAQAAWALVLGRMANRTDAVFGNVASGRSPSSPGADTLVGFFANTIPLRIRWGEGVSIGDWLRQLRDQQLRQQKFADLALYRIFAASGRRELFDSLFVFQNLPASPATGQSLRVENYSSAVTAVYPLTIVVMPGEEWDIYARHDPAAVERGWLDKLIAAFVETLTQLSNSPEAKIEDVWDRLPQVPRPTDTEPIRLSLPTKNHAPPRNRTEVELVNLWQELLRAEPIGIHDNYFELGGRSLQAMDMVRHLERMVGRRFQIGMLLSHPTVAQLSVALHGGEESTTYECLVPFKTEGDRPPLFCFHAGGGHVMFYRDLAEAFPDDQPVYGLQPVGLDGSESPLRSIPAMATRYLQEIRRVQRSGPYFFLGHCLGSHVALEIAHQLWESGERQIGLFVIDAPGPGLKKASPAFMRRVFQYLKRGHWRRLVGGLKYRIGRRAGEPQREPTAVTNTPTDVLERVTSAFHKACGDYRSKRYAGPLIFLKSNDSKSTWHENWKWIAPHLQLVEMDAQHRDLFITDAVNDLARAVDEWMKSA